MVGTARRLMAPAVAAAVALAAVGVQPADAQTYQVKGSCREGVPQGLYELRMPDGRLRVLGAFNHGRRTGSFIFWSSNCVRVAHIPFDDDDISGTVSLWYGDSRGREPQQKLEAVYVDKRLRDTRSWYADGRPRAAFHYENDSLVGAQAWDARGNSLRDDEARSIAARDRDADGRYLESLFAVVHANLPKCDSSAAPMERAG